METLRVVFILTVWAVYIPCQASIRCGSWLWGRVKGRWRILAVAGGVAVAITSVPVIPLVYGRFALLHEASFLARTSARRSEEDMRRQLMRKAFQLGYTDGCTREDAFTIEQIGDDDGIPRCSVSIKLLQRVDIAGPIDLPIRIHAQVTKAVDPDPAPPKGWEEILFGE